MLKSLMPRIDSLMAEVTEMGVEIAAGMPVPEDDQHAMMAVHMLSALVAAHKDDRHTPFCRCAELQAGE